MFKTIESKAPDWPGDTEKEGLGSHCVWKPEDGETPFHFLQFRLTQLIQKLSVEMMSHLGAKQVHSLETTFVFFI
jgi:hypothetical protein